MSEPEERKAGVFFDNKSLPLAILVEGGRLTAASVKQIEAALKEHMLRVHTDTRIALDEALKLNGHYATLLNQYCGGERMTFENAEAWIERLRELGKLDHPQRIQTLEPE